MPDARHVDPGHCNHCRVLVFIIPRHRRGLGKLYARTDGITALFGCLRRTAIHHSATPIRTPAPTDLPANAFLGFIGSALYHYLIAFGQVTISAGAAGTLANT